MSHYAPGDRVIYHKPKNSNCPGPRAKKVWANPRGEDYSYFVDKYWVVEKIEESRVTLRTRTGKLNVVEVDDEHLRHAKWWEKWFYQDRFPTEQSDERA